jgi:ribosomal protein S18 acetylase RimI-like enzyme
MNFYQIELGNQENVALLSNLASYIVKEHFDPIIGSDQNDYMISKFQTVEAISEQLKQGYQYYFCMLANEIAGFVAFYKRNGTMYLSKFYLKKEFRRKGLSKKMLSFVVDKTKAADMKIIILNVNRNNDAIKAYEQMGFYKIGEEKNDIGHGYFMDDYVMQYDIA